MLLDSYPRRKGAAIQLSHRRRFMAYNLLAWPYPPEKSSLKHKLPVKMAMAWEALKVPAKPTLLESFPCRHKPGQQRSCRVIYLIVLEKRAARSR